MQVWHEVRENHGALCRLPRACAWSWYRVKSDEANGNAEAHPEPEDLH